MALVRGCNLPDDLIYDVENHVWYKEIEGGQLRIGMTAVAAALAGQLVAVTPKKVGRGVRAGKSCATIESGKWVGPARSAVAGEVTAVNDAVITTPALANEDPYEKGWLLELAPEGWDAVKAGLLTGAAMAAAYEAKMVADGFEGCA